MINIASFFMFSRIQDLRELGLTKVEALSAAYYELIISVQVANSSKVMETSDQMTLGQLIEKLKPIVERHKKEGEANVYFDFEYIFPTHFSSWRGSYCELAIGFSSTSSSEYPMTVTAFYKAAQECIGKTFTGYKGGDFIMSEDTPLWVANYGNAGNTALIEVIDNGYSVILVTGLREV